MKYLVLIADIDEFNPCKNSLGDLVKKEYKIKHGNQNSLKEANLVPLSWLLMK